MPIDARGMLLESRFGAKPAAHYIAKKISIERSHLIHLKTAVGVLKHSGVLKVLYETFDHHDEIRSYVALTTEREVVFIRIHAHQRTAELFMAPSNPPLETVLITALAGLLDIDTTVHRKHRMRNVHIIEYPHTTHKPQS